MRHSWWKIRKLYCGIFSEAERSGNLIFVISIGLIIAISYAWPENWQLMLAILIAGSSVAGLPMLKKEMRR